jgi:arsenical pump membrane protein
VVVAGLFVLVGALEQTGALDGLTQQFTMLLQRSAAEAAAIAGGAVALLCNVINNLPAGLIAASMTAQTQPPAAVTDAVLIAVDLGPNLSVTGSLATILWLIAMRRDGEPVGFWPFLRLGSLVMPPTLVLVIATRLLVGSWPCSGKGIENRATCISEQTLPMHGSRVIATGRGTSP